MQKRLIIEPKDLTPSRNDFEVIGVFNPAIIKHNGEYVILARVAERVIQNDQDHYLVPLYEAGRGMNIIKLPKNHSDFDYSDSRIIKNHENNYLTSISHLRVGRSADGISFTFDPEEVIMPANIYEEYGLEDPRVTELDGRYYITYSAVSGCGINVGLMTTRDFKTFSPLGNIFHSDNKDCVIFPQKIGGKYYALHRPSISQFGKLDIWLAESDNLINWGNHKILLDARVKYAESYRVGAGAVPLLTDLGWLEIYHSADRRDRYHLTAMVFAKDDPTKVIMKSKRPLIFPTEEYEKNGFKENVVFTCGLIREDDILHIYYGAADQRVARASLSLAEVLDDMEVL